MPLVFIVGGAHTPGANSYATVERYRELLGGQGEDGVDLDLLSELVIQRHLINASRFIDQLRWLGSPLESAPTTPRLGMPRKGLEVFGSLHFEEGWTLPEDSVVWLVTDAVCLFAEDERLTGRLIWRSRDMANVLKSKRSILGSSKTWEDSGAGRTYPQAMSLLKGLYDTTGNQSGSVRAIPI